MSTSARENEEKFDCISNLPDDLLCHVLSFLTTKEASLTSVLSKRWRNLLAFVPNLYLDDSVFLHPEEGTRDKGRIIQSFVDFVDRILALQGNSSIKKVSLKCLTEIDSARVDGWISNVLARGVLDMDLFINLGKNYRLPSEISMSRTLVKLKIRGRFPIDFRPGHISLPILKTLVLDLVKLYEGQLQMLLSASPVLEELDMANIRFPYQIETVSVSSPSLKTLTMKSDSFLRALSFNTPNLVFFKNDVAIVEHYPLVILDNLVEARIYLKSSYTLDSMRKLVRGIGNVQKLYVSSVILLMLAVWSQEIPMFNNLTFLDIDISYDTAWRAPPVFLQKCPHLETLVIKGLLNNVTDESEDSCICISREDRSLVSCPVKRLEIREFVGFTGELEMIKHFLDYFPCLKEMEIYITDGPTPQGSQALSWIIFHV